MLLLIMGLVGVTNICTFTCMLDRLSLTFVVAIFYGRVKVLAALLAPVDKISSHCHGKQQPLS